MRTILKIGGIGIVAVLLLTACEDVAFWQEEPEEPDPTPIPEPSPEEMVQDALQQLFILDLIPPNTPLQMLLTPEGRRQLLQNVASWRAQAATTESGRDAIEKLRLNLDSRMREARDDQNAALVLLICDILDVLGDERGIIDRYREWAEIHNNRPVVTIRGWFQQQDIELEEIYAFVQIYTPETGEIHSEQVREGDIVHGLEFVEIIGRNRGMRIEYLATGDRFDVYGPRRRPRDS